MRINLETLHITATRREAIYFGLTKYFNGKPCPKGHLAERQIGNSTCIECVKDGQIKRRTSNKKLHNEKVRNWAKSNRARVKAIEDRYWKKNKDKQRAKNTRWKKKNPEYVKLKNNERRAAKQMVGGTYTCADIDVLKRQQNNCCAICFIDTTIKYHLDHIIPLSRGGTNWPENLQILCPTCNLRKGVKTNEEFLRSKK